MIVAASLVLASHLHLHIPGDDICCEVPAAQERVDPKTLKAIEQFQKDLANDRSMGKEAADFYDKQYPPTKDLAAQKRVELIGAKLALIANTTPNFETTWGDPRHSTFEYRFRVVDDKDINAFSLPGGYIYVFKGLVDFVQSDDELAGVLAHEICHASQRHVAWMQKEQSKLANIQIPLILASIFTGGAAAGIAGGSLVGTAVTNGWSVKAETSADYGGFQLMTATGYNPTGLITFMERLQMSQGTLEKVVDLGIYRTHPPSRMRAERVEGFMKSRSIPIKRSLVTSAFRVTTSDFKPGTVMLKFGTRNLFAVGGDQPKVKAEAIATRLNEFFDSVPELYEITLGDGGEVFGKSRLLVRFDEDDAEVNAMTIEALQNQASKALRSSAFSIAYHIWEGRG